MNVQHMKTVGRPKSIYRVTIGKDIHIEGTIEELAERLEMKPISILNVNSPSFKRTRKNQKMKLEKIGTVDDKSIYQMYDKNNEWVATGTLKDLENETRYQRKYLLQFIKGSKTLDTYMSARKTKNATPPILLVKVED